jgi:hypothetical protein
MPWVERKGKTPVHRCRLPILWWWTKRSIGHGSVWQCPRCEKRWIVGGLALRYWSSDLHLWRRHD